MPKTATAWLSLDEEDNDPVRFFAYLFAVMQTAHIEIGQAAQELLDSAPRSPVEPTPLDAGPAYEQRETEWVKSLATALINDIVAKLSIPSPDQGSSRRAHFVLVLDDYHRIRSPTLHTALQMLLDRQPPSMHLVIITREDPPLMLARQRALGRLTEIRVGDLRFTAEEAAEFFRRTMGLNLTAEAIADLEARTEGWIAGLQLAAISLKGRDDVDDFVQTFTGSHRYVIDYLVEEVLRQQTATTREFLLQTSVLDRFCAPLCDAVTEQDDSKAILAQLERANLFLVPLDDERLWYRYHHLFADSLRAGLKEERLIPLHQKAAHWFSQNGFHAEAVRHALVAKDFDLAADLIEQAVEKAVAWSGGDFNTFRRWLNALPTDTLQTRPLLSLYISRALYITGQFEKAEAMMREVYEALSETRQEIANADTLLGVAATFRALYATERGDYQQAVGFVQQARECLPPDDAVSRARATHALGLAHECAGNVVDAIHAYRRSYSKYLEQEYRFGAIAVACHLALAQITRGHLRQAIQTCEDALWVGEWEEPIPAAGLARTTLGTIFLEQNDLAAAERDMVEGLEQVKQARVIEGLRVGYMKLARLRQAQGRDDAALAAIHRAEQITHGLRVPRLSTLVSACRTRIGLTQGDLELAVRWARDYERTLLASQPPPYLREYEDLTLVRVMLAQDRHAEALLLLDKLRASAEAAQRMGSTIEILALQALALQAQGDQSQATDVIRKALALAKPEGYARLFLDEGQPMARLLLTVATHGTGAEHAAHLLTFLDAEQRALGSDVSLLVEPLSERESEVLRLIAAGLSNREIAEELVIAFSTAKWHASNIYGKLGVRSRTQAISRARELNLL